MLPETNIAGFTTKLDKPVSSPQVLVIACGALAHDLIRVKKEFAWEYLDFQCLPAELHNYPEKIPQAVRQKIQENRQKYAEIFVAYADCGTGGMLDQVLQQEGIARLPGAHCYEMFSGSEKFMQLHEAELGTFYLTDFLARHFDRLVIKGLALDRFPQLKQQFFGHYKKLVYLSQLKDQGIAAKARKAAKYLGVEYEEVFTGDSELVSQMRIRIKSIANG